MKIKLLAAAAALLPLLLLSSCNGAGGALKGTLGKVSVSGHYGGVTAGVGYDGKTVSGNLDLGDFATLPSLGGLKK